MSFTIINALKRECTWRNKNGLHQKQKVIHHLKSHSLSCGVDNLFERVLPDCMYLQSATIQTRFLQCFHKQEGNKHKKELIEDLVVD